jgi:hypothetical protein
LPEEISSIFQDVSQCEKSFLKEVPFSFADHKTIFTSVHSHIWIKQLALMCVSWAGLVQPLILVDEWNETVNTKRAILTFLRPPSSCRQHPAFQFMKMAVLRETPSSVSLSNIFTSFAICYVSWTIPVHITKLNTT